MTAAEILALARTYLRDEVEPYGWSDAFLLGALNRAQQEAALRTLCLEDDTFVDIDVTAGDASHAIDPRIIRFEELRWDGTAMIQRTFDEFERINGAYWRTHEGVPLEWYTDGQNIVLYPIPLADGVLTAKVKRMPLLPLVKTLPDPEPDPAVSTLTPEIPTDWHRPLVHWMCWEAYQVPDNDLYRPDAAQMQITQFEQVFGPMVSARVRLHQLKNPRTLTLTGKGYIPQRGSINEDW